MTARSVLPIVVTAAAAVVGFAAVYVTLGGGDNAPGATTRAARSAAADAPASPPGANGKLNVGQVTGFVYKKPPEPMAEVAFKDGSGKDLRLDQWKGRVVLLNLWATWCAPCRHEMPGLARLQSELGSKDFEVVALALDRAGPEAAQRFLDSIKADTLRLYIDVTARGGPALRVIGMPTTILIDREGREVGRMTGPAEWDSPEAKRLVQSVIGG
ncbi:MAG: TlpA family protein disulfide reductase [Hyphomicrobiaceae bacterium]